MTEKIDTTIEAHLGDHEMQLPWSLTYAIVTDRLKTSPQASPATGTGTHSDWHSDDTNVDDA